jgi:hypothetical protein
MCDCDSAKAALEHGEEELIPSEVVYVIMDGQNPIKVWSQGNAQPQWQRASSARDSGAI